MSADIARLARIQLRESGSLRLVAAGDTAAFLDACLRTETQVLGIEGFKLLDGGVRPDMSAIADLSGLDDSAESVAEAKRFLEAVSTRALAFDFVLEGGWCEAATSTSP